MRKLVTMVALLALVATPALADYTLETATLGSGNAIHQSMGPRGDIVYSNTTYGAGWYRGQAVGDEIGDELVFDKTGTECEDCEAPNWCVIDSLGASMVNAGAENLMDIDVIARFYDTQGTLNPGPATLVGSFSWNVDWSAYGGLPPGYSGTYGISGVWPYFDIPCTEIMTVTIEFANPNPATVTANGQKLMDPPTVGASGDYFWNGTGPYWSWFGGVPPANLYYEVDCRCVPEPASLALLVLGGVAALRRRR